MKHPDILVLGGGIIGLACARELVRRGFSVEVIERDTVGQGASWAAAGMLSPMAESFDDEPFFEACRRSRDLWMTWAAELEDESGMNVDHDRSGALIIDLDGEGRADHLRRLAARTGEPADVLDGEELRALVPDLAPGVASGLLIHGEHRVDNRKVCAALAHALERCGVRVAEHHRATRLRLEGDGVRLEGTGWTRSAGRLLIATGAWTGGISGLPDLPVSPVRGQMLQLTGIDWPWAGSVWGPHHYAVRRLGDRLLIGATVEEAGYAAHPTPAGVSELLDFCRVMFPALADKPLHSTWAGLRPATPDRLPMVGPLDDPRLWVATGHFRNGILLAPWTAQRVADQMSGGESSAETVCGSFSPRRFASSMARAKRGKWWAVQVSNL